MNTVGLLLLLVSSSLSGVSEAKKSVVSSGAAFDPQCAPGWTPAGSKCLFREEIPFLCDGKKWSRVDNSCLKIHAKRAIEICEPGWYPKQLETIEPNQKHTNLRSCASKDIVDSVFSCPEGYELVSKKKCVSYEVVPALGQSCDVKGLSETNTGTLVDGSPACPLGSYYDKHHHVCVVVHELKPQRICPAPYTQFGQLGFGWRCQLRDRVPMAFMCEKGYELAKDGTIACLKHMFDDKKKFCPPGFTLTKGKQLQGGKNDKKNQNALATKKDADDEYEFDYCLRLIYDDSLDAIQDKKIQSDLKGCSYDNYKPVAGNKKVLREYNPERYFEENGPNGENIEGLFIGIME